MSKPLPDYAGGDARAFYTSKSICPDEGACHHNCAPCSCFRVRCCDPLGAAHYPNDEWPAIVIERYGTYKEVDDWWDTTAWRIADVLHRILCKRSHQMDQCWGLVLPYDLAQPTLSSVQREYLSRAIGLVEMCGSEDEALRMVETATEIGPPEHPLGKWTTPKKLMDREEYLDAHG
jgi:hypothetical protein